MPHYLTKKRKQFIKILALVLTFAAVFPLFSACGETDYNIDSDEVIVCINNEFLQFSYKDIDPYIKASNETNERMIPHDLHMIVGFGSYNPEPPQDMPEKGNEITLLSNTYVFKNVRLFTVPNRTPLYLGSNDTKNNEYRSVVFSEDGKIYVGRTGAHADTTEDIGQEEAKEIAIDFINGKLKNAFEIDVDLSEYNFIGTYFDNHGYSFTWGLMVNKYCIHKIVVDVYKDGAINSFAALPMCVEKNNPILTMSDKEFEKQIFPMLAEKLPDLTNNGYKFVFEEIAESYPIRCTNTSVHYIPSLDKYALSVYVNFRLVNEEKDIDLEKRALFLIPLS